MPPPQPLWLGESNKSIKYSGSWSREYGTIYHESAIMRTTELGDTVSLEFWGSGIKFLGAQGWNHSVFTVALDDQRTIVNGSCCIPSDDTAVGTVPQVVQFEATDLRNGLHTLTIKNDVAGPQGTVLEVDAFLIYPTKDEGETGFFIFVLFCLFLYLLFRKPTHVNITVSPSGQSVQHTTPSAANLSIASPHSRPSPLGDVTTVSQSAQHTDPSANPSTTSPHSRGSPLAPSHVQTASLATPSTNTSTASPGAGSSPPQHARPPANESGANSGTRILAAAGASVAPKLTNDSVRSPSASNDERARLLEFEEPEADE
ncbi:hypothetical protein MSAN_00601500 [Mycena sanguinolenta]|uniref:Uncharacterized protein n=1 Tax=Mycena sanguinolenta TaxID=230812 RepID=A0A8H6ZAC8_9AGAR|nr:hypothetical protein MSAN_00601500 [Mycena sanguinolenta]